MSIANKREEDALAALVSASLHLTGEDISDEEVELFLKHSHDLPPQYMAALDALGANIFEQLTGSVSHSSSAEAPDTDVREQISELSMAMNRKNAEDKFSQETEEELERQRSEIIEKLKANRRQNKNEAG
jgi:hypothetical protein